MSRWDKGYRNFDSLDEMNAVLIDRTNSVVMPEDTLIFHGDFLFGPNKPENFVKFRRPLKVRNIIFIRGNHDDWMDKPQNAEIIRQEIGQVFNNYSYEYKGYKLRACHYSPEEEYELDGRTASHDTSRRKRSEDFVRNPNLIYTYGHHHATLKDDGFGLDIGVDTTHNGHPMYTPYHMDEVIEIMKQRGFKNES